MPVTADTTFPSTSASTFPSTTSSASEMDFTPEEYKLPVPRGDGELPAYVTAHINLLYSQIHASGEVHDRMSRDEVDHLMVSIDRLVQLSQACQMLSVVSSTKARELTNLLLRRYVGLYRAAKDKRRK